VSPEFLEICEKKNAWPAPFWSQAVEKLQEEKPKVYEDLEAILEKAAQDNGGSLPNEQSLADKAWKVGHEEKKRMERKHSSLPVNIRNTSISIREKLDKLIGYAKVIKDKAQPLISLDPTGYAKLAWMPFGIIIDVSIHQGYQGLC
jgi:hypothetical protein